MEKKEISLQEDLAWAKKALNLIEEPSRRFAVRVAR